MTNKRRMEPRERGQSVLFSPSESLGDVTGHCPDSPLRVGLGNSKPCGRRRRLLCPAVCVSLLVLCIPIRAWTCSSSTRKSYFGFQSTRYSDVSWRTSSLVSSSVATAPIELRSSIDGEDRPSKSLIDAAAAVTQDSCRLLGVKSIGVDYGLVKTGVSVTVGYEPKAIAILRDMNSTQVCEQVVRFAETEQASRIIVGLPLHKNGTIAEQTNVTLDFATELTEMALRQLGPYVSVELWDERYTSKEAAARAKSEDPSRWRYGTLDADAAGIILEHYYRDNGEGAQTIELDEALRDKCLAAFQSREAEQQSRWDSILAERERKIQNRKDAIARMQSSQENESSAGRKKKKKRKKRR